MQLPPIPQLAQDKANHFMYGSIAATIAVPIGAYFGLPRDLSALLGSTAAGVAKEALDFALNTIARKAGQPEPHTVDVYDFLATAAGGLPVAGLDSGLARIGG